MLLIDVNVLVYAHRDSADRHDDYRKWLEAVLAANAAFAVSELVLAGFLRVVTNPRAFDPPSSLADAITFIEAVRSSPNYAILAPGNRHWDIFIELCRNGNARGNLVMDAYHAALAIEHGCEWITADRGFGRWPGLKWRHPLDG
jgi:toxin-antitoxin system PIN domain toxin